LGTGLAFFVILPGMKFVLEMELDENAAAELGRALRYWAGAFKQMELVEGSGSAIYDSKYQEVGQWTIIRSDGES
jgi:hypothetical protein